MIAAIHFSVAVQMVVQHALFESWDYYGGSVVLHSAAAASPFVFLYLVLA